MKYKDYIEELKHSGIVPGLARIRRLLHQLGDPQDKLRCIHVAGTNGKGSVCAMLAAVLMESGAKTGCFNSPFISCYNEIIRINEKNIPDEKLEYYYGRIREASDQLIESGVGAPTLFEAETAIAFCYFADEEVDYAIIECGMGGELDATNVIRDPVLSIITSIEHDHMQYLGNTLKAIAEQKAGIIKKGSKCVLSPEITHLTCEEGQHFVSLEDVFKEKAQAVGAELIRMDMRKPQIQVVKHFETDVILDGILYTVPLAGHHQIYNAITAIMAAEELLKPERSEEEVIDIIRAGLKKTRWPGRMEKIGEDPLIIRDGAHNPAAASRLAQYLQANFHKRKRIIYVTGVLKDKDYEAMIDRTIFLADRVYVFTPDNARGLEAEILADVIRRKSNVPVTKCHHVNDALAFAIEEADPEDLIVLWGSLSFMKEMKGE